MASKSGGTVDHLELSEGTLEHDDARAGGQRLRQLGLDREAVSLAPDRITEPLST